MAGRRTWVLLAIGGAVALLAWLARPARTLAPEERIRALLAEAARAAEQRKPAEVAELLSERFRGGAGEGALGRDDARRLLALELLRGQWVSVSIASAEVIVDGARARASVDALLSRAADRQKGLAALLPGEAAVHRFRLELEEEPDGRWRVVGAGWRQVSLQEALAGPGRPEW
jgi:hypothetical protein